APLDPPQALEAGVISASLLTLHGWEDPMAPTQSLINFAQEMTLAKADWQIHIYGHAKHAFTFEGADIPALGIKYNEKAHQRSQHSIAEFLGARPCFCMRCIQKQGLAP